MPRPLMLVFIGGITFFLAVALFIFTQAQNYSSPAKSPETCNDVLIQGPPEKQTNILFVGTADEAEVYRDYLLAYEPFSSNREMFNFYRIDKKSDCARYKKIALYCYSQELQSQAAVCPHDFIVALEDAPVSLRASAYMEVASINTNLPKTVLLHELGHLFGLDEEYEAGYNPGINSPNCKTRCGQFTGTGCFQECSDGTHLRSVDEGVMRTLSPADDANPYGSYNTERILDRMTIPRSKIAGFASQEETSCLDASYLLIEVDPRQSEWQARAIAKERGCTAQTQGSASYALKDDEMNTVFSDTFTAPRLFTDGNEDADNTLEGQTFESKNLFYLTVPSDTGAASVVITDSAGNERAQADLNINNRACEMLS